MTNEHTEHPASPETRSRQGDQARKRVPPESHAELSTHGRADPVQVLAAQIPSRLQELVPLRHARMLASPFSFYRGGAAVMAGDLARGPSSGLTVQLCGDAHLSNFGVYASPERRLVFDVNDFDETLPGPWEWDVKRLTASLTVAGRQNGFSAKQTTKIVLAAARRYQKAMTTFADLGNLAVWYARVDVEELQQILEASQDKQGKSMGKRLGKSLNKARTRDQLRSLAKLTEVVDGHRRFRADPPVLVPLSDLTSDMSQDAVSSEIKTLIRQYSGSLAPGHRELVRSFDFVDMARKVVGVGSVGTRCWVVLMQGRDENDPLFLQVKEAQPSVLAPYVAGSKPFNQGSRVVTGQHIMQAASDVFLGFQSAVGLDGQQRDFYLRQLQDWKGSAQIETMNPHAMRLYGQVCAWTLARAHARSGDRIAIAAYLSDDDAFAQAMATYAESYADLNERDYAEFGTAVESDELLGHPHAT